jgi:hypothetical protein
MDYSSIRQKKKIKCVLIQSKHDKKNPNIKISAVISSLTF